MDSVTTYIGYALGELKLEISINQMKWDLTKKMNEELKHVNFKKILSKKLIKQE